MSIKVTTLDTQQVYNALVGSDGWQRIIHNYKCRGKDNNSWCLSLSWASKINQDDPSIEQYRCPDCGTVHEFKVPYGANK